MFGDNSISFFNFVGRRGKEDKQRQVVRESNPIPFLLMLYVCQPTESGDEVGWQHTPGLARLFLLGHSIALTMDEPQSLLHLSLNTTQRKRQKESTTLIGLEPVGTSPYDTLSVQRQELLSISHLVSSCCSCPWKVIELIVLLCQRHYFSVFSAEHPLLACFLLFHFFFLRTRPHNLIGHY